MIAFPNSLGKTLPPESVSPNSIGAFHFERIYFCSQSLKDQTENAGFRVGHAEVIYPGIATDRFWCDPKPASSTPHKFLIVSRLSQSSGVMTALQGLREALKNGAQATLSVYGRGESEQIAQLRSYRNTAHSPGGISDRFQSTKRSRPGLSAARCIYLLR